MPIYEYKCGGCGEVFEVLQKYSDPAPEKHECGSREVQRIMSAAAFVFKGEGWYVTDYARKEQAQKAKKSKKSGPQGGEGGSSAGSDKGGSSDSGSGSSSSSSSAASAA